MIETLATLLVGLGLALSAHAATQTQEVRQTIALRDGSTLYVFADGKMGIQDQLGRAASRKPGTTLETRDGQKITMVGNEVARVTNLSPRGGQ